MATTSDVGVGTIIRFNNELCVVTEWQHRTPGNLRAFYQGKMRSLKNGRNIENRFRSGESVEIVRVEYKELQYIYEEGDSIVCMDNETYEQVHVPKALFGEGMDLLKEGMNVKVAFDDETPILAEPPIFVELQVTYTEPGLKGDTATNALKPATVETGATIMVPLFIEKDDIIRIDTRTRSYCDRVK